MAMNQADNEKKKFSSQEIEVLVEQAGDQAELRVRHANKQILAGMINRPLITKEQGELEVKHAKAISRLQIEQNNEMITLRERQQADLLRLHLIHAAEAKALEPPPPTTDTTTPAPAKTAS